MMKNVPESARFTVAIAGADPDDPQVQDLVAELDQRQTQSVVVRPDGDPTAPPP